MYKITAPFDDTALQALRAGDSVLLSGTIYTARDAAHKRMVETLQNGGRLPVDLAGQVIYYAGPTPAKPGQVIGSCGPTTSGRMDAYAPLLIERGLRGMIGKGERTEEVYRAMQEYGCVYLGAVGGAGALISKCVRSCELVAYEDLGTEAIRRLVVVDMPLTVIGDIYGGNLYRQRAPR